MNCYFPWNLNKMRQEIKRKQGIRGRMIKYFTPVLVDKLQVEEEKNVTVHQKKGVLDHESNKIREFQSIGQ